MEIDVKNNRTKNELQKGMSLVEVVIAVGVSAVALAALISLSIVSSRTSEYSRIRTNAIEIAKGGIEVIRSIRDNRTFAEDFYYTICNDDVSCAQCVPWTWVPHSACPWKDSTTFGFGLKDDIYYLYNENVGGEGDFFYDEYIVGSEYTGTDTFYIQAVIKEGPSSDGTDKDITVNVGWYFHDKPYTVSMSTLLTNWK